MGGIDVLVNNAGWTHMEFQPDHSLEDFERVIKVNLLAPYEFTRRCAEAWMQLSKASANGYYGNHPLDHWVVVNTGSGSIDQGLRSSPGYVASKRGLHGVTATLSKEFAGKYPITMCTVSPATVEDTAMIEEIIERLMETRGMTREEAIAYNAGVPMGRWCSHEDCWRAYDFAINRMTNYWSGTNLQMKGGSGIL